MGKLIGFLVLILISIPVSILKGLVLSDLWEWFVVPLGVPSIGIAQAIGLTYVVWLIIAGVKLDEGHENTEWYEPIIYSLSISLVAALMFWGGGAIVKGFM